MLDTLYFVIRSSSPVIQQDAWYFFDVFLKKAINGTLTFGDFFVRRAGADHAQPLFKLEMLMEWHFFNLDFSVGSIIGVISAALCSLILYRVTAAQPKTAPRKASGYLAWVCISAVLFSLNADAGGWTWPLVALENVTTLIILGFIVTVWSAYKNRRYFALVFTTLLLGVSCDDSAIIAVVATLGALALMHLCDVEKRHSSNWKIFFLVSICIFFIRIAYSYAPIVGGSTSPPALSNLVSLFHSFCNKGWWMWLVLPLALPVVYKSPFMLIPPHIWTALQIFIAFLLLAAHVFFWRKAFSEKYNVSTFIAVCLMLLSYGWTAGIILGRVSVLGNDYLNQPRYISLYATHLIALFLMWGSLQRTKTGLAGNQDFIGRILPISGCIVFLALQIPMALNSWHMRPYLWAYDVEMVKQIDQITLDPSIVVRCLPEQYMVCGWSPERRRELTEILRSNQLNIFSPQMQQRHRYLPKLN